MSDRDDMVTVWDGTYIRETTRDLAETGMLAGAMQMWDERGIYVPNGPSMLYPNQFPFSQVGTPQPTAVSLLPVSGAANTAQQITITGTNFTKASVAIIAGKARDTDYVSATTLIAYLPKTTAGAKAVHVTNPDGDVTTPDLTYTAT